MNIPIARSKSTERVGLGSVEDVALADAIREQADSLRFASEDQAAYHAHVHEREGIPRPADKTEIEHYHDTAREIVRTSMGETRYNQDGKRAVTFRSKIGDVVVVVDHDGDATMATYMPKRPKEKRAQ